MGSSTLAQVTTSALRALVLASVLVACGSKKAAPDPAAICAATAAANGTIVLRSNDPAGSGKARGLKELASRAASRNAEVLAELDRFIATADTVAIFTAHVEERERKVREDLEIVRAIVQTITDGDWPFPTELRFPSLIGARAADEEITLKVAELLKPLADGSALGGVNERAASLAAALHALATSLSGPSAGVLEAIKTSNIAHGKLNETAAALFTTGATLSAHADEQNGRRFAEATRLWTRLAVAAARLADPWPAGVPISVAKAFVIAGPRQELVICSAPRTFAASPAIVAALPSIKLVRDGIGRSLGLPAGPVDVPSLKALAIALDGALKPRL